MMQLLTINHFEVR